MADYKVKYIAHYQTSQRRYRRPETMEEKEFDTKWEAEKFVEEWKENHWYAERGWVEARMIDCRSEWQKAYDAKVMEHVDRYIGRMWRKF